MARVNLAQYTHRVEDWAEDVVRLQKDVIYSNTGGTRQYGPQEYSRLQDSLTEKVKLKGQLPDKIAFAFPRYGVFLQLGVSKGYEIQQKGSGIVVKTGPGEFKRRKVDWFTSPLRSNLDELAIIITEEHARLAALGLSLTLTDLSKADGSLNRNTLNIRGLE